MPESFPLNPPPTDPESIAKRRKEWEAQKRSSTKPLPRELSENHVASLTTEGAFANRVASREGARNIARQLEQQNEKRNIQVPPKEEDQFDASPYTSHSSPTMDVKKIGFTGLLHKIFPQFGNTEKAMPGKAAPPLIESTDVIDRISARPEKGQVDITRYVEGLERFCHELDTLLATRFQNVATEYMQQEVAVAKGKLADWKRLLQEVHEVQVEERPNIPFYVQGVQEAYGDAAELVRRLSLRKFN